MQISGNSILITGGATGIGLALADAFVNNGNEVIICGRRESALQEAKTRFPRLHTRVADLNTPDGREQLADWLLRTHPNLNMLVNNAGIQREFRVDQPNLAETFRQENEIDTNLTAPVHLTFLLLPQLLRQPHAAVVNVTSGLGYVPKAIMPVYCATKAGLQSFTLSLRHQLAGTSVKVFDIAPPIVDTDLDQGARQKRGQTNAGISPEQVARESMLAIARDRFDVPVGMVKALKIGSKIAPGFFFGIVNKPEKR